ncbi:PTPN9 [Acanthosepion pharaonis]|uniref:Tyrosine-protein phosphatase non-receptor type 9 n=1 Tax=Acanthosepion pharaonis TaxID=158019 RepID=A0A812D5Q4_ACAPH|nr:PTPN9 [Sepia pharaonis]
MIKVAQIFNRNHHVIKLTWQQRWLNIFCIYFLPLFPFPISCLLFLFHPGVAAFCICRQTGPSIPFRDEFSFFIPQKVRNFIEEVSSFHIQNGNQPLAWNTAMKFLTARKFDVKRAIDLYRNHQITREREDLLYIDLNDKCLQEELQTEKFTILSGRDLGGAAIALFTARLHFPPLTTHQNVLKALIHQLDAALESLETQRHGLVFIYDMTDSKYGNFDYNLSIKILNMLKGAYPARLKKVLIVTAPLWFKAPFKILRLFVREKLRDRVFTVNLSELPTHIPCDSIPKQLGGYLVPNHTGWLKICFQVATGQNPDMSSYFISRIAHQGNASKEVLQSEALAERVRTLRKKGLQQEYLSIRSESPTGSFHVSKAKYNLPKNRYLDVLCYDHSRVVLSSLEGDPSYDYINANYVDGYKQKNAYITTQGCLTRTIGDFWRMVWEQKCLVIVMLTRIMERNRLKCEQYWPLEVDTQENYDHFVVHNTCVNHTSDYRVSTLILQNSKTGEERIVQHMQFLRWPDYGVPNKAESFLQFLLKVQNFQAEAVHNMEDSWQGHPLGPPIVVHCSAGIGRTGTFITTDINIRRFEDVSTVELYETVRKIRSQRAFSIQVPDQYVFCHLALIEYAVHQGLLESKWLEVDSESESD